MLRRVLSQPGHGKSSFCLDLNWTRLQETETSPRFNTSEMFYEISCFVKFCCVFCKAMFYKMCFLNLCCVLWYVFCDMLLYCLKWCVFCNGVMFSKIHGFSKVVFWEVTLYFMKCRRVSWNIVMFRPSGPPIYNTLQSRQRFPRRLLRLLFPGPLLLNSSLFFLCLYNS